MCNESSKIQVKRILQYAMILCFFYVITGAIFYMASVYDYATVDSFSSVRLIVFCLLIPIGIKYIIQLFASISYPFFEKVRQRKEAFSNEPLVSVLVPAWNEEVGILKTIQSVLKSRYANFEIIIINDGSTDNTHRLVSEFINTYQRKQSNIIPLSYFCLTNGGKANALNYALNKANGEIIVTIDADSVMDEYAITNMVKRFTCSKVAAVAGNVIVGNRKKPIELMQQLEYMYGFFFKRADSTFNAVYIIGGAAAAYRKHVLMELGGFDENIITEDIEMSTRILAHGYKTRYAADAVIYTEGPSDWKGLCDQRLRWKFGRLLTFIKHKNLFFSLNKKHNSYLSCLLLPLAVYAEFLLLLEGPLLAIFYGYTLYTHDYLPLVFVTLFLSTIIMLQIAFDSKARFHSNLLCLAPVAWIIFYIVDIVEFQALFRSIKRLVKREGLEWQRWVRVGLLNQKSTQSDMPAVMEFDESSLELSNKTA